MDNFQININNRDYRLSELAIEIEQETQPKWLLSIFQFILQWFDSSESITQKTSGSTSTPKNIELKKSAMKASARRTISFFNLQKDELVWLCLPIDYIAGKMQVVRCIEGNLKLIVSEPVSVPEVPELPIKFAALVPMQLKRMFHQNQLVSNIDTIILGGAASNISLIRSLQNLKTKVYATYGMTETCSHIALQRLNGVNPDSAFFALDGINVFADSADCLIIEAFDLIESPIETNDLVKFIDKRHFRIIGRADNVINSGGLKISPEEIEAAIAKEFNLEIVLIGIPDQELGQKLVLVSEKYISKEQWDKIIHFITMNFGKNKVPKLKKILKDFPRTNSMKLVRSEIKTMIDDDKI